LVRGRFREGFERGFDDAWPSLDGLEDRRTVQILLRGPNSGHPCLPEKTSISRLLLVSQFGSRDFKNSQVF
jgi:hypothetical protein